MLVRNRSLVLIQVEVNSALSTSTFRRRAASLRCREILQRCIYPDRDLVLPGLGNGEPDEIFFIVASTTLELAEIMMVRIREQLGRSPELKASGVFKVSASPLELPAAESEIQLEKLVLQVA